LDRCVAAQPTRNRETGAVADADPYTDRTEDAMSIAEAQITNDHRQQHATIHRRPWLPALNLSLAVAAVVISVFALATTPDLPTAVPAARAPLDPSSNPLLPGCNLGLGVCHGG
jgi:hypothetical protein